MRSSLRAREPFRAISTLSFDLSAALRRLKPQRRAGALARRNDDDLPYLPEPNDVAREIMLDTCVYIDVLQGVTPPAVEELIAAQRPNHSSICLAELTHLIGRLDPDHPGTTQALNEVKGIIGEIPLRRLTAPSTRALGEAGMLAGLVARLSGQPLAREQALLNDAILDLHAVERGCVVLTRNLREFDLFDQLMPHGRVLFYRRSD